MRSFSQLQSLLVGAEPSGATGQWYTVWLGAAWLQVTLVLQLPPGSAQVGFGLSHPGSTQVLHHGQ